MKNCSKCGGSIFVNVPDQPDKVKCIFCNNVEDAAEQQ